MTEITFFVVIVTVIIKYWSEYTGQVDDHHTKQFSNMLKEFQSSKDAGITWQYPAGKLHYVKMILSFCDS